MVKMILGILFTLLTAPLIKFSLAGWLFCCGYIIFVAPIYATVVDGSIDVF